MHKRMVLLAFVSVFMLPFMLGARFNTIDVTSLDEAKVSNNSQTDSAIASLKIIWVPDNYTTIQEAINNASNGDAVFVRAGTYYEHVVVNKTVSLMGEDKNTTIIDGNATGTVVSIMANNVTISRFTIQNSGNYPSSIIHVINSGGNCIIYNTLRNSGDRGIYLDRSVGNTISDNNVVNISFYGILLGTSTCNIISNNNVSSNSYGIYLFDGSKNNFVSANNVSNNGIGVFLGPVPVGGGYLPSSNNIVSNNIVSLSATGIMVGGTSSNSTLTDNILEYNKWGIYLQGTRNNTISGNNIIDNDLGIYIDGWCNYTIFYHNNFINNAKQVNNRASNFRLPISWDDGYPSGGNYWSDYTDVDIFSGPYQNETRSDGIGDAPYIIDENNRDNYPLMSPWGPAIMAKPYVIIAQVGESFTVNVTLTNGQNLYGVEVSLYWNASILEMMNIDIRLGVESHPDGVLHEPISIVKNETIQEEGRYLLVGTSVAPAPSFNGSGTIFRITFNATNIGSCKIDLETKLADKPSPGNASLPITHTTIDSTITIIPEFPSAMVILLLLIVTLVAVMLAKRAQVSLNHKERKG